MYEVVLRQAALVKTAAPQRTTRWAEEEKKEEEEGVVGWGLLGDAYDRCGEVCAEYAKTFYLGQCPPSHATAAALLLVIQYQC